MTPLLEVVSNLGLAALGAALSFAYSRGVELYRRGRSERRQAAVLEEVSTPTSGAIDYASDLRELPKRRPVRRLSFPYLYATGLSINAVRGFTGVSLELRFPHEGRDIRFPNVNLLLGDNGSGKSTILRSIALAALAPSLNDSGYVPYHMVRQGFPRGRIEAGFAFGGDDTHHDTPRSMLTIERKRDLEVVRPRVDGVYWDALYEDRSPAFFVVGYGVNRRTPDVESRSQSSRFESADRLRRFRRISSLFDEETILTPLQVWLPDLSRRRTDEFTELFERLMPVEASFTGAFLNSDPVFAWNKAKVPLGALSDGFRAYVGWLSDLLYHLVSVTPEHQQITEIGGIVLVDEVDLLLHPSWQRTIVPVVSELLPNLQFVFTSHSPIVAGTLEAENIFLVREAGVDGASEVVQLEGGVHGLSADQILLSSYFELESSRSTDAQRELEELGAAAAAGDTQAADRYLDILERGLNDDRDQR